MAAPYFFLRPILAADTGWAAFDWQSADRESTYCLDFVQCFSAAAGAATANLMPLVLPIAADDVTKNEFIDAFDPSQAVFVLPPSTVGNKVALERCRKLSSQGYRFCIDVDRTDILRQIPITDFESIRFDAAFARQELTALDLIYVKDAGFRKIATHVGTHEMYGWLYDKGFDLYDSHFLASRNPATSNEPDLTRLKLLKLLNIVKQDGDTREIEAIFREEPKLSYNLLRLVNSVAVGARTKISSFSQAIAILGRRQLQRWLQLLIYANNLADGSTPNPLMQIAAARGRQMELLSASLEPRPTIDELSDNAFLTGLFSLLDVLINLPMSEILKELPMQDEVVEALLSPSNGGTLGRLLAAIATAESGNLDTAASMFAELGIGPLALAKAQFTAYYWASRINVENDRD